MRAKGQDMPHETKLQLRKKGKEKKRTKLKISKCYFVLVMNVSVCNIRYVSSKGLQSKSLKHIVLEP